MKYIISVTLLSISILTFAQEQKEPILAVTGSAKVVVKPDLSVLNISVSEIDKTMGKAVKKLGDKSDFYGKLLKKLDFKQEDLKTTKFSVSKNRVRRNNMYVDSGFVASQRIRVEFEYKKELLQKILTELSKSEQEINFNFNFSLSDSLKSEVQSKILEYAVNDANSKAAIIAESSGTELVKIIKITYGGWGSGDSGMEQVDRENRYPPAPAAARPGNGNFNFTPDDLLFRDTIKVEWLLKQ